MTLRNPNLNILGTGYPYNIYEIRNRFVSEHDNYSNVTVYLRVFTDESRQHVYIEHKFDLVNLPTDPTQLTPGLYQQKLLEQHGEAVIDGTKLSDFQILS